MRIRALFVLLFISMVTLLGGCSADSIAGLFQDTAVGSTTLRDGSPTTVYNEPLLNRDYYYDNGRAVEVQPR